MTGEREAGPHGKGTGLQKSVADAEAMVPVQPVIRSVWRVDLRHGDARQVEHASGVGRERGIVREALAVALEEAEIGGVEADERDEEADVRFGEGFSRQEGAAVGWTARRQA